MFAARRVLSLEAAAGPLAVWRGTELARPPGRVIASGHPALDAELPGGGWPLDGMVELLQQHADLPFWQVLLPALGRAVAEGAGPVVLSGPPHAPFSPCLAAQGLAGERLLCVRANRPAPRLWAAEQALRCAEVSAVLAWLPQARDAELRRLQLAAQEQSRLLFVFRDARTRQDGSPARLRLWLAPSPQGQGQMDVHILKRRGPPLETPVQVRLHAPVVEALLAARTAFAVPAVPAHAGPRWLRVVSGAVTPGEVHALDRAAAA